MLEIISGRRIHETAAPYVVSRAFALAEEAGSEVAADQLRLFVSTLGKLAANGVAFPSTAMVSPPAGVPDKTALARAEELTAAYETPKLREELVERLTSQIRIKRAPRADLLAGFLMGWAGERFKNGDYQAEFLLTQETSKYHLRELRNIGVIAQIGTRKAAKYELAFHR